MADVLTPTAGKYLMNDYSVFKEQPAVFFGCVLIVLVSNLVFYDLLLRITHRGTADLRLFSLTG